MNKKQVLATAFFAVLLFSALVGVQFVNLASANFLPPPVIPYNEDPPIISILSPVNKTYNVNHISLNFTVTKPASWYASSGGFVKYKGTIDWVDYNLDGTKPASWYNSFGGFAKYFYDYGHLSVNDSLNSKSTVHYSKNLTGLSEGMHTLVVCVSSTSYYLPDIWKDQYTYTMISYSSKVNFTIDTPPRISLISPEKNATYGINNVSLTFTVSEPTSWIGYSLDGQANATITGNTTLSGLPDGSHNLVVYANDTAGNIGTSETVYFSIKTKQTGFLGTGLPIEYSYAIVTVIGVAIAAVAGNLFFKRLRQQQKDVTVLKGE